MYKERSSSDKTSFASLKLTSVVAPKTFGWKQETEGVAFEKLIQLDTKLREAICHN